MAQEIPWSLFYKCFQNQATAEEISELNSWLKEDVENVRLLEEVRNIYLISRTVSPPFMPDVQQAWQSVDRRIGAGKHQGLTGRFYYAIAAVAAILICAVLILPLNKDALDSPPVQYTEVITSQGQKTRIILPDSSLVWLNSSSRLMYSTAYNQKDREVILDGEAFFTVTKDPSKTFRVQGRRLSAEVYGTSFNVRDYRREATQSITVIEGLVGVSDRGKEVGRLSKGEQASADAQNGSVVFSSPDTDLITSWMNNTLIFRNRPLADVLVYLERWYGVEITVAELAAEEHNYTFAIKTESLREVLEMMKIVTPLRYEINGEDVTIWFNNK